MSLENGIPQDMNPFIGTHVPIQGYEGYSGMQKALTFDQSGLPGPGAHK